MRKGCRKPLREVQRILVKMPNWLGDAVMSLPALEHLRMLFPRAWIACLLKQNIADLLLATDSLNEVIGYTHGNGVLSLARKVETIRNVRKKAFDLAVLLPNSFESALWMFLAGIPHRAGYKTDGRGFLLSLAVPPTRESIHQVQCYLRLCEALGQAEVSAVPRLRIPPGDREWAEDFVASLGVSENDVLIGLCPGAAYGPAKRWLPGRFVDVCQKISEAHPAKFAVFGGGGDVGPCVLVSEGIGRDCINLCGKTTLRQLAAMVEKCALVISNDSGAMHLSAAIGTHVIAIFGSTDPSQTAPPENCTVFCKHVPCSPCFKRECPVDLHCMTSVTAEEIYERAAEALAAQEAARSQTKIRRKTSEGPRGYL